MAWAPVVTSGDIVDTPQGRGQIRRVSELNHTAQVDIDGQLFEIPVEELNKAGDDLPPQPAGEGEPFDAEGGDEVFKVGDKVENKTSGTRGVVSEVTQRTVRVTYDNGNTGKYQKRLAHKDIRNIKNKTSDIKVGDKVELLEKFGGSAEVGDIGEVVKVDDDNLSVNFPSQDHYSVSVHAVKKVSEEATPQEQPAQSPDTKGTADALYGILGLQKHLEDKIDASVDGELKELRDKVKQNQKLEVKIGDKVNVIEGLKHKQLEQLITYASMRLSPLLVGMAGTGKTHAGEQTAVALGLDFYSMSVGAQTSKSDIIGYMDASGRYVRTHFRDAYEFGGVFLMDEIDAGNANVLIQINAALSNGLCAFPDAMVKRHEDFVFIASANTFGNGANRQYVGRNQLDAATLDRFAVIEWHIDDELEENLAVGLNGKAWYMAVRGARDYVAEKNIRALISPRATQKGSRLLDVGQGLQEVIDATLLGSVPDDKKADVTEVATTLFNKFASEVPNQLPREVDAELRVSELVK